MPIKGYIESSFLDWDGKLCAVVFFGGCNLRCGYCHNKEMVIAPERVESLDVSVIFDSLALHRGWIDGVCFYRRRAYPGRGGADLLFA